MVAKNQRVEWKCVLEMCMAQCVMTSGMSWRPEWSAGNLDTLEQVIVTY